jgi:hypothetical protein
MTGQIPDRQFDAEGGRGLVSGGEGGIRVVSKSSGIGSAFAPSALGALIP